MKPIKKAIQVAIIMAIIPLFALSSLFSQPPQKMSYQAVIRNSAGQLVSNTQIGMRISILQGTSDGTSVYSEVQTPTTNANGLVSIEIGGEAGFETIDWSAGPSFIKTEIAVEAPFTAYTLEGTSQILSVPYAIAAGALLQNKNGRVYSPYLRDDGTYAGLVWIYVQHPYENIPEVSDIDGNIYKTVKIGNQVWMTENLKVSRYRNGDEIGTTVPADLSINDETDPKYQWAYDGDEKNASTYGRLYTWYAATENRGICPEGWHLPNSEEWSDLFDYLGDLAGGRMKKATSHWIEPNIDAINDSKFNALPGGYRTIGGFSINSFIYLGESVGWWSSDGFTYSVSNGYYVFYRDFRNKGEGHSVRCLKD